MRDPEVAIWFGKCPHSMTLNDTQRSTKRTNTYKGTGAALWISSEILSSYFLASCAFRFFALASGGTASKKPPPLALPPTANGTAGTGDGQDEEEEKSEDASIAARMDSHSSAQRGEESAGPSVWTAGGAERVFVDGHLVADRGVSDGEREEDDSWQDGPEVEFVGPPAAAALLAAAPRGRGASASSGAHHVTRQGEKGGDAAHRALKGKGKVASPAESASGCTQGEENWLNGALHGIS